MAGKFLEQEVRMPEARHMALSELEAGLETVRRSPQDEGSLAMIVCRPAIKRLETNPGHNFFIFHGNPQWPFFRRMAVKPFHAAFHGNWFGIGGYNAAGNSRVIDIYDFL